MSSGARKQGRPLAQANLVSFELHTLGWEAFQDLCGHIAREVLGQTVVTFSGSSDAGQDGAFQGFWKNSKGEAMSGRFVLQCKFVAKKDARLHVSQLDEEFQKVKRLVEAGEVQTYLLITNAKLSGEAALQIRLKMKQVCGVEFFEIYGAEWITQQIRASNTLRVLVPRIYGLGDLSQILDERVYRQAEEILHSWKDNITKFVPTDSHARSARALLDHGFVLLLGDPMAGKSTIAAALAIAAADRWKCRPVFVTHPDEIRAHWNPDEPRQFFWVDDAFGQIQCDWSVIAAWNRAFSFLATAIKKGARVILTSRTYVYRDAIKGIKRSAFPLIDSSKVVIEVEKLTPIEKQRILYNHVKLGQQDKLFKLRLKPYLKNVAAHPKFFPEIARRLADPFFTKDLSVDAVSLSQFVEEPKAILSDIISQVSQSCFAALSLLFMRSGKVNIPPSLDDHEEPAMRLINSDIAGISDALLTGC